MTDASHDQYFRREAVAAVEQWKFEPRVFMNRPIAQRSYTRIRFRRSNPCRAAPSTLALRGPPDAAPTSIDSPALSARLVRLDITPGDSVRDSLR